MWAESASDRSLLSHCSTLSVRISLTFDAIARLCSNKYPLPFSTCSFHSFFSRFEKRCERQVEVKVRERSVSSALCVIDTMCLLWTRIQRASNYTVCLCALVFLYTRLLPFHFVSLPLFFISLSHNQPRIGVCVQQVCVCVCAPKPYVDTYTTNQQSNAHSLKLFVFGS